MEKYNYQKNVEADIRSWLDENTDYVIDKDYDDIYDELWISASVTGNGSGSYTFNAWEAEENLCHNGDLLEDACREFGTDTLMLLGQGAEAMDVTIRCYLLGQLLPDIWEEWREEYAEVEAVENK